MSVSEDKKYKSGCKYTESIKVDKSLLLYMKKQAESDRVDNDELGLYRIHYVRDRSNTFKDIREYNRVLPTTPMEKSTDWAISFDQEVDMTQNGFKKRPRRMTMEEKIHMFDVIYEEKLTEVEEWVV
jgi:hypothetical protein